jgi:hypothetical protein
LILTTPYKDATGNYVHDIILNPYNNWIAPNTPPVYGMYWDKGSDQWTVKKNLIERVQRGFKFSTMAVSGGLPDPNGVPKNDAPWGAPTGPIAWQQTYDCDKPGKEQHLVKTWCGQLWGVGPDKNYFWPSWGTGDALYKWYGPWEVCFDRAEVPTASYEKLTSETQDLGNAIRSAAGPHLPNFFNYPNGNQLVYPKPWP